MTTAAPEKTVTLATPYEGGTYRPLPGGFNATFELTDVQDTVSAFDPDIPQWRFTFEVPESARESLAKKKLPALPDGVQQGWRAGVFAAAKWGRGKKNTKSVDLWESIFGMDTTAAYEAFIKKFRLPIDPRVLIGVQVTGTTQVKEAGKFPTLGNWIVTDEQLDANAARMHSFLRYAHSAEYVAYFSDNDSGLPF